MALGLQPTGGSGDVRPYVSYDARAGRMFRVDRAQDSTGTWNTTKVDITRQAKFVADIEQIRVGWINYTANGPVKVMAVYGQPIPERPADLNPEGKPAFRQGFEMTLLLAKECGGGPARDFGSNAACVIEAVDALHDAYLAAPERKAGKLPVVTLVDTVVKEVGKSSNYAPVFKISGWVDRPDALPKGGSSPAAASVPQPEPVSDDLGFGD